MEEIKDHFTLQASMLLDIPMAEVTKEQRQEAKQVFFKRMYTQSVGYVKNEIEIKLTNLTSDIEFLTKYSTEKVENKLSLLEKERDVLQDVLEMFDERRYL